MFEEHDDVCPQNDPYNQFFPLFSSKSKILLPNPTTSTTEFNVKLPLRRTCHLTHTSTSSFLFLFRASKYCEGYHRWKSQASCMYFIITALDSFRVFITFILSHVHISMNTYRYSTLKYIYIGVCVWCGGGGGGGGGLN
jgi:hypothetical protein